MYHKVLTIAGFDGSGGAGLQADLKTIAAFGCYGLSVLTAVPVQNTMGVQSCYELPLSCLEEQFDNLLDDIEPDSVKIGMLFKEEIIVLVSRVLQDKMPGKPVVLDPVMQAKSGHSLLRPEAEAALKKLLLPLAAAITPNLPETAILAGRPVKNEAGMLAAGLELLAAGPRAALIKGGHLRAEDEPSSKHVARDLLMLKGAEPIWLESPRIETENDHGTGCTLSAAIASGLALGWDLETSCRRAKDYLTRALEAGRAQKLGRGHGPVHHFYEFWEA